MTFDPDPDRELLDALKGLARAAEVPPVDPAREAALLDAFDRRTAETPAGRSGRWWLSFVAAAAALLIAFGIGTAPAGHRRGTSPPPRLSDAHGAPGRPGVQPETVGEFIPWPGAAALPPFESGELVRTELPVSLLPSLGVAPPATQVAVVKADVIIGQDGLARAVRFVAN